MGRATQSVGRRGRPRPGIALATVLLVLVILVAIPAALFAVVSTQQRAERNRADQRQAELLAQAGVAHVGALFKSVIPGVSLNSLLLGSDNAIGGNNDGLLIGHVGLTDVNRIPSTGVEVPGAGRYYVRVIEDEPNATADVLSGARIGGSVWSDGGTHTADYATAPVETNNRVLVQCLGITRDGARALVNLRMQRDPSPGLIVGGDLDVFARVVISGTCADIHANGQIRDSRGSANWGSSANYPTAAVWSATRNIPNYFIGTKLTNQPVRGIPIPPAFETMCSGTSVDRYYGMSLNNRTVTINLDNVDDGRILCVYGNVSATCNVKCRNSAVSPRVLSIIATGSIRLSASKTASFRAAHPSGYQFIAMGDLEFTETGTNTLALTGQGSTYCGSQIRINIDLSTDGQVVCSGGDNPLYGPVGPAGPDELFTLTGKGQGGYQGNIVTTNAIDKQSLITFNCSGALVNPLVTTAWYLSAGG